MNPVVSKFIAVAGIIFASVAAGYVCGRRRWLDERAGEWLMTAVGVFGYPAAGFLSIWATPLRAGDVMLPALAVAHIVVMTLLSLLLAPLATGDRAERGLLGIAGGLGNNGFTMGAFVLYLLYGEQAMGLANIYGLAFVPVGVLLMYPLARHFASDEGPPTSLARLMVRSVFDWRSIGLPVAAAAIVLSALGVPRPEALARWRLLDAIVYTTTPLAFFSIGLRLRISRVLPMWRPIAWLAAVRFCAGPLAGAALLWLATLTPWGLAGRRWDVFMVQSFVPTAVTMVAIANMFRLRPQEASVLFVLNTAMYLVLVLPLVFRLFG
jgi:predicted permease